ncbi:MAG TPA: hypothetical protein VH638_03075 [Gemmatimonadaceae bacterium]|jgi:hypothetical protein
MSRFVPLLVLVLAACRTERVAPPAAEFLIAAGDSSFWVRSQNGRLKIRGAPLQLARLRGRFHEIYVADDDRSHYEAVIVGQRVFRRDLQTGDSVAIFEDTTAASLERWYREEHPTDPRVSAEDDVSEHPIVEATAEIGLLDAFGPYQSYEYRADGVIQGGAEWHVTRRGVLDLEKGHQASLASLFGDSIARHIVAEGKRRFSLALDSVLASPDARARAAAEAIADFEFDSSSFAIVRDRRAPAVQFFAPGHGARAGGMMIGLAPIIADSAAAWWTEVRGTLSVAPFDSSLDRWERPGLSVVTRYDATGDRATLVMLDSAGREWPVARISAPAYSLLWLDAPPLDPATRRALTRAFDEAALYSEQSRTALGPRRERAARLVSTSRSPRTPRL